MKYIKRKLLVLAFFFCLIHVYSQEYGFGAIPDPVRYNQIDSKPVLVTRNSPSFPRAITLKQYSPKPESQGLYGTCTAWATTFAARTISESITIERTNSQQISNNVFSPYYTYVNISDDPNFKKGIFVGDALKFLKEKGAVRRLPSEKVIPFVSMPPALYVNEKHYPILDYQKLFQYYYDDDNFTTEQKVNPVKQSLAEKKPVIIAMKIQELSFGNAKGVWEPFRGQVRISYHAMCVIGYDDDMYGGAFLIQNSWGDEWGNEGLIWVRYRDFAEFVYEAYEIIEDPNNYRDSSLYSASIEIEVTNDSRGMPVVFDQQGFYKTSLSYTTGTRFRFLMTNRYPAYVYAFSTDTSEDFYRIFPMPRENAFIDLKDNITIVWPNERESMQLFGDAGTDYLVVLYSRYKLDIDAIEQRFINERGSFPERVARAVGAGGGNFIPYNSVQYTSNRMEFSANTLNPRPVFGLLLAIDHR